MGPIQETAQGRSHRTVSRRRAISRRFRAQSRSAWRRLWFWTIVLIVALAAEIYLSSQNLDAHPDYRMLDYGAIAIVVFAAMMLIGVIRGKLRCPECHAPIANQYGGRLLTSLVCSSCGARLGSDSTPINPKKFVDQPH